MLGADLNVRDRHTEGLAHKVSELVFGLKRSDFDRAP